LLSTVILSVVAVQRHRDGIGERACAGEDVGGGRFRFGGGGLR
jgi:hypothetical protein